MKSARKERLNIKKWPFKIFLQKNTRERKMQAGISHKIFYLKIVSKKQKKHGVLEMDRLRSESLLVGMCDFG